MEGAGSLLEGGTPELSLKEQVLKLRKKYKASLKSPLTPTINAIIAMFFMKLLLSGIVNT